VIQVVPCTLEQANEFVGRLHRHSKPVVGAKFSVGVRDVDSNALVGVAIVGRPVARLLDDGLTAEIVRVCTDGRANACSMLYGACRKAARAMGYQRIVTYTLPNEGGASLRAAGFQLDREKAGAPSKQWHNRSRRKAEPVGDDLIGGKWRWAA
jgi:hypothetical protein